MCVSSVPTGWSTGWPTGLWMLTLRACASQVGFASRVDARPAALQSAGFEVREFRRGSIFAIAARCSYLLPASALPWVLLVQLSNKRLNEVDFWPIQLEDTNGSICTVNFEKRINRISTEVHVLFIDLLK